MKRLLTILATLVATIATYAGGLPTSSTASDPVWYMIKFMSGGCVLEAKSSGQQVQTASMTGDDAQLWRFEGSSTGGYTIVSKSGLTLHTTTAAKEGMFSASTAPSANKKFAIQNCTYAGYEGSYLISPNANKGLYMNQWGGAGSGKQLGLWDKVDANCPLSFVSEAEFQAELAKASLPLIPMPTNLSIDEGQAWLTAFTTIAYPAEEYKALAEQFADFLGSISGTKLTTALSTTAAAGTILLSIESSEMTGEAYTLKVNPDASAQVGAATAHGLFNGLTTLRQLFYDAKYNTSGLVQCVTASDQPRFGYRGFMLDIARHYFDKAEVKKLLDVMALYKISKFHWHLTDDQGWRIHIPEYPLLTAIGAVRGSSNTKPGNPRFVDDTEYGRGMYYTLDDLREIVAYAQKLHIDIMPEIDLPGHMVAAIASYPEEFACAKTGIDAENKTQYTVRINEGISKDVLNVAKPEVMDFLYCVLGHVAEVFPYPVIHIGGDECPTNAWDNLISAGNKQFKEWMSANNLATSNDIQPWLVNELGKWLKEKYGKDVVCWNELVNHWNTSYETQPIIMCYNGDGKGAMSGAVAKGLKTIYTGCWPFYLDMYQTYKPAGNDINAAANHLFDDPYTGGYGNNTLMDVYNATPTSSIGGKENMCIGVGANLWTESCCNNEEAEYQFFPRMLALAEVGWLPQADKSWVSFKKRVQAHFNILDEYGINYATYDKDEEPQPDTAFIEDIVEAHRLLEDAQPDAVGYPSAGAYDALRTALSTYENGHLGKDGEALHKAVADFKAAPVCQPVPGKTYRIVSASVAWSRNYAGSTMYVTSDQKKLRFHFTPQTEPEELFTFEPYNDDYRIIARLGEKKVYMGTLNNQATVSSTGSVVRVDAASVASTSPKYYDYIPGVVLISNKNGYTTDGDKSKRLNAYADGYVYVKADATVGHTGCWRIVEVTDWAAEIQALADKCERLGLLADELVGPARELLATASSISEADYDRFAALYAEYLKVKYTSLVGVSTVTADTAPAPTATYDLSGRRALSTSGVTISGTRKKVGF